MVAAFDPLVESGMAKQRAEQVKINLSIRQELVASSADEDVYQMNFDLFDWSR